MIDGTKIRVLVPDNNTGALYDRTESIEWVNPDNGIVRVQFKNGGQSFPYRHPRARLLENVSGFRSLKSTELVKVKGEVWYPPLTIATFTDVYDGSYSIVRFLSLFILTVRCLRTWRDQTHERQKFGCQLFYRFRATRIRRLR